MDKKEMINYIYSALNMREENDEGKSVLSIQGEQRENLKSKLTDILLDIDSDSDTVES